MEILKNLIGVALAVLVIVAAWKLYIKAGKPGWAVLVPFYNLFVWVKIAGRPGWWLVLFIIPIVNIVMSIIVSIDIAKRFGKGLGFGIGLALLPFVFIPILGLGNASYKESILS